MSLQVHVFPCVITNFASNSILFHVIKHKSECKLQLTFENILCYNVAKLKNNEMVDQKYFL